MQLPAEMPRTDAHVGEVGQALLHVVHAREAFAAQRLQVPRQVPGQALTQRAGREHAAVGVVPTAANAPRLRNGGSKTAHAFRTQDASDVCCPATAQRVFPWTTQVPQNKNCNGFVPASPQRGTSNTKLLQLHINNQLATARQENQQKTKTRVHTQFQQIWQNDVLLFVLLPELPGHQQSSKTLPTQKEH
jgi:hypothetical protein